MSAAELTRFAGLLRQGLARAELVAEKVQPEVRDLARAHYLTDWCGFLATHMEQSAALEGAISDAVRAEEQRRAAAYEAQTKALFPDAGAVHPGPG